MISHAKAMFGTILISACTLMHIYVFWRAASVPLVDRHVARGLLIALCVALWATFYLGRALGHRSTGVLAARVELLGMNWMAVLFLTSVCLLAIDIVTGFGLLLPRLAPSLRGWAFVVAGALSVIAFVQGLRPPVVQSYEVGWRRASPRCRRRDPTLWSSLAISSKDTARRRVSCSRSWVASRRRSGSGLSPATTNSTAAATRA